MADSNISKGPIDKVLNEKRVFEPPDHFQKNAVINKRHEYEALWNDASHNPLGFWEKMACDIHWYKKWHKTLEWNEPFAKWFVGATTNASYNCLDRNLHTRSEKLALVWEGEDGSHRRLTYRQLYEDVCKLSNALERQLLLKRGDTVAIYMPLIPEAIITMLSCARIGVIHSVIFAGFSAHAVRDRILDAECKAVFTTDIGYRRGQILKLKETVDEAVSGAPCVKHVVVMRRDKTAIEKNVEKSRSNILDYHDWDALCSSESTAHKAKELDSEHPLFYLYTSGTTGKPKGIVHSTGGYLVGCVATMKWVFDLKENDIYWCTADIGWVTGHSYVVYGPLALGATCLIFEGALNYPHSGRIWEIIQKHRPSILYTAPTAIRSFMRTGDDIPRKFDLSSLRLLGTVGEPINPEAWMWYYQIIGGGKCPIVDTWWQTETGAILISPLPGVTATKPGSATRPFPGICADVVNEQGESCKSEQGGFLVIRHPWPSMMRTIHKDPERFKITYWSKFKGLYFTGDGAYKDSDGYFWIMGRVDDVINVSGHRLGTMEVESALVSHPSVAEAAVVGRSDELKGQALVAFVTPKDGVSIERLKQLRVELQNHVVKEIGAIARPDDVLFTKVLPKTRSGKIMRRLLKDLADGQKTTGDTTTLENPALVEIIG